MFKTFLSALVVVSMIFGLSLAVLLSMFAAETFSPWWFLLLPFLIAFIFVAGETMLAKIK